MPGREVMELIEKKKLICRNRYGNDRDDSMS